LAVVVPAIGSQRPPGIVNDLRAGNAAAAAAAPGEQPPLLP